MLRMEISHISGIKQRFKLGCIHKYCTVQGQEIIHTPCGTSTIQFIMDHSLLFRAGHSKLGAGLITGEKNVLPVYGIGYNPETRYFWHLMISSGISGLKVYKGRGLDVLTSYQP